MIRYLLLMTFAGQPVFHTQVPFETEFDCRQAAALVAMLIEKDDVPIVAICSRVDTVQSISHTTAE